MILDNLKKKILFNTNDFHDDFFCGMSSSEYNIAEKIDDDILINPKHPLLNIEVSFSTSEFEKVKQEIVLIKELGIDKYRFSLSWARIIPDGIGKINKEAIDFYNNVLDVCIENGVEPLVTLYDSYLPIELQNNGGWSNREVLSWFENYVAICVTAFKEKVNHWIVINNPSVFTGVSRFLGIYPLNKKKLNEFLPTLHHVLLCQSIGYKKIKEITFEAQVGTFFSCNYIISKTNTDKDLKAVERVDTLLNKIFIEPSLGFGYPTKTLPFLKTISKYIIKGDDTLIKTDFDFISLQICTSEIVSHNLFVPYLNAKIVKNDKQAVIKKSVGFEISNQLIYLIIKKYSKYEGVKKILIIENTSSLYNQMDMNSSLNTEEPYNIQYFLMQILNANRSGGKVVGYFVPTLKEQLLTKNYN